MAPGAAEDLRVSRIAALTLVNAMIFHAVLAERDSRVRSLKRIASGSNVADTLTDAWELILREIDYVPIFQLARQILVELNGNPGFDNALKVLATAAMRITARQAALRHDLMGRIYHRLLADAKYFGAFYTTIPAATLLLKLALGPREKGIDWSNLDKIQQLRVGDLACGTGTLLKASLQTIVDNYVRARATSRQPIDLCSLHQGLVERVLIGFDVIPFAIHLAASALAMHEPDVPFREMHLYTLHLSGTVPTKLGSLNFFDSSSIPLQADLYGGLSGPGRTTGTGDVVDKIDRPLLDLCVMNPPFTRSVGGNLLFGHAPTRQRTRMQSGLRKIVRKLNIEASITAGLAAVFIALGHRMVKPGGQLALVIPRAVLTGIAWARTRQLIGHNYHVRYIIVSHEPNGWNFSENTQLSECLLVARRGSVCQVVENCIASSC